MPEAQHVRFTDRLAKRSPRLLTSLTSSPSFPATLFCCAGFGPELLRLSERVQKLLSIPLSCALLTLSSSRSRRVQGLLHTCFPDHSASVSGLDGCPQCLGVLGDFVPAGLFMQVCWIRIQMQISYTPGIDMGAAVVKLTEPKRDGERNVPLGHIIC